VIVTLVPHNCSYEISDIISGHRISKVYYGYTKAEAIAEFIAYVRYTEYPNYEAV
jgi:hypothetical protein